MSKSIDTGGDAFPYAGPGELGGTEYTHGMNLRDYFAVRMAVAQLQFEGMEGCDKEQVAAMAYELADALLDERVRTRT